MSVNTSVLKGPKNLRTKVRGTIARTDTTGVLLATLPKGARLIGAFLIGNGTLVNNRTTANITLGNTVTATELISGTGNAVNLVSVAGGFMAANSGTPLTADTPIYAVYAESGGTASSTGGPWYVVIVYTDGNLINNDAL